MPENTTTSYSYVLISLYMYIKIEREYMLSICLFFSEANKLPGTSQLEYLSQLNAEGGSTLQSILFEVNINMIISNQYMYVFVEYLVL